ncbi:MAG TPA: ABC transporter permease, partial [Acidimicrobiales bacterium]|nr:ABC transporter permease [Acidimicrobiales bacterium]
MTTAAGTVAATDLDVRPRRPSRLARAAGDTLAITGRNLRAMQRVPQVIVFSTIQPIVFVLLFRYVFGGAIKVPGIRYVDFLMPGIFVQTITFGAINTGVGLSADLATGMIERFRSLPMARSAVLAGRTFADLVRNAFVLLLMVVVGLLVGFRPDDGPALAGALVLVLLFSFALSW